MRSGTRVREHRPLTARQHGGEPPPLWREHDMPDGVDTAVEAMKAPGPEPLDDAVRPDAEREQLLATDHAVLSLGDASQQDIDRRYGAFRTHLGS
jgi:hypothetical protein